MITEKIDESDVGDLMLVTTVGYWGQAFDLRHQHLKIATNTFCHQHRCNQKVILVVDILRVTGNPLKLNNY